MSGAARPYGSWRVDRVWIDPRYTERHDERYDYAFLRVSRSGGRRIESAAGADTLRVGRPFHLSGVTATGYPESGDRRRPAADLRAGDLPLAGAPARTARCTAAATRRASPAARGCCCAAGAAPGNW